MNSKEDLTNPPRSKSCFNIFKKIFESITLEPVFFLFILPSIMKQLTTENLALEKACRVDLQYNETVCDAMVLRNKQGYDRVQEIEVQKLVSKVFALRSTLNSVFPVILMVFLGSWSDRHGRRKPIIILPIIGELIASVNLILCSYFLLEIPVLATVLSEAIPHALGGTWACAFLGIYAYASSLASDEQKTTRIGTIAILQTIAMASGIAIAGCIIKPLGLIWVYVLITSMLFLCVLYVILGIEDEKHFFPRENLKKEAFLNDLLDLQHVKNTFKVYFKSGPNNRRSKMILLMSIVLIAIGTSSAESSLYYLYVRIKFGWNERDFGTFNAALFILQFIGSIIAVTVLSKMFRMHDALLGVLAFVSKFCGGFVYAFSPNGLIFCIGMVIEIFNSTSHIAMRSLLAKIVKNNELGQSNAVIGICDVIIPMLFIPLYAFIYNNTIGIFPGTHFLVSSSLYFFIICLFLLFYKIDKEKDFNKSQDDRKSGKNMEKLLKKEVLQMEKVNRQEDT